MSFTEVVFLSVAPGILAFALYLFDMWRGKVWYLWIRNCGRSPEKQLPAETKLGFVLNQKKSAWLFFLASLWSFVPTYIYSCCGTSRFVLLVVFVDFLVATFMVFMFSETIYDKWDKFLGFFRDVDEKKKKFDNGEIKIPSFGQKIGRWIATVLSYWPFGRVSKTVPTPPKVADIPKVEEPKVDYRQKMKDILDKRGM